MTNKIPIFPIKLLAAAVIATILTLYWLGINAYNTHSILERTLEHSLKVEKLRGSILYLDEVLTMSARMAAATSDSQWIERYNHYESILKKVISDAVMLKPKIYTGNAAMQTDEANMKLVAMELKSFELVKQGKSNQAKELLFSDEYDFQKRIYSAGMDKFAKLLQKSVSERTMLELKKSFYILISIVFVVMSMLIVWVSAIRFLTIWKVATSKILDETTKNLMRKNSDLTAKVGKLQKLSYFLKYDPNMVIEINLEKKVITANKKALSLFPDIMGKNENHPLIKDFDITKQKHKTEIVVKGITYIRLAVFIEVNGKHTIIMYYNDISHIKKGR